MEKVTARATSLRATSRCSLTLPAYLETQVDASASANHLRARAKPRPAGQHAASEDNLQQQRRRHVQQPAHAQQPENARQLQGRSTRTRPCASEELGKLKTADSGQFFHRYFRVQEREGGRVHWLLPLLLPGDLQHEGKEGPLQLTATFLLVPRCRE